MRIPPRLSAFTLSFALLAACGDDAPPAGGADGGTLDAGGESPDAGPPPDSGVVPDSGEVSDSGVVPDSGVTPDSGVMPDAGTPPSASFEHGVASGDPLADRVMIWTRLTPGVPPMNSYTVQWRVASDEAFTNTVSAGTFETSADRDYTVKVDATGLSEGTTYFYEFTVDGERSPVGRTKTLPSGSPTAARFAVVSCSSYPTGYFNAYGRIADRRGTADDLDAVIHLGDYFYEYGPGDFGDEMIAGRELDPLNETVTLEDYRLRHALYRTDGDLQEMHRAFPMIAVWDDHESANDAWTDGAENHNPDDPSAREFGVAWDVRRSAAIQAYYEWMPIREPAMGGEIWRRFQYGDLLTLHMLETRLTGRDEQLNIEDAATDLNGFLAEFNNPARSLLGSAQETWLEMGLTGPLATTWQVIGNQVMMGQIYPPEFDLASLPSFLESARPLLEQVNELVDQGRMLSQAGLVPGSGLPFFTDSWDGYVAARQRVFSMFRDVENVVVLTGDAHNAYVHELVSDGDLAAYSKTSTQGVVGVEFVTPSVTSPGFESELPAVSFPFLGLPQNVLTANPQLQFTDLVQRGYTIVEFTPTEATAKIYFVATISEPSDAETLGFEATVQSGRKKIEIVD